MEFLNFKILQCKWSASPSKITQPHLVVPSTQYLATLLYRILSLFQIWLLRVALSIFRIKITSQSLTSSQMKIMHFRVEDFSLLTAIWALEESQFYRYKICISKIFQPIQMVASLQSITQTKKFTCKMALSSIQLYPLRVLYWLLLQEQK